MKILQYCVLICMMIFSQSTTLAETQYAAITSARSWLNSKQLYLNIGANITLNDTLIQTLQNGIPLTFAFEIKVTQERPLFFDKTLIKGLIKYTLEYHALSNQYILTNLNAIARHDPTTRKSFPTLSLALNFMTHLKNIQVGYPDMIKKDYQYQGYIRLWLDIESLPTPMQLPAFFDQAWNLQTEPFNWPISNQPPSP